MTLTLENKKKHCKNKNQITESSHMCIHFVPHTLGTSLQFLCTCYSNQVKVTWFNTVLPPDLVISVERILSYQGNQDKYLSRVRFTQSGILSLNGKIATSDT